MPRVSFSTADVTVKLPQKRLLKQFIQFIISSEGRSLDALDIIFCSDEYLLSLNRQFLQHDYYTDILTFDLSNSDAVLSEIYISTERVLENSRLHGVTFLDELTRIIFHGVLHLCGFGDKTAKEKNTMTLKENEYLEKYAMFHVKQ